MLANDCEPADLDAVQATDTVIMKDTMARNGFMMDMMPEHFPFVILLRVTPFSRGSVQGEGLGKRG